MWVGLTQLVEDLNRKKTTDFSGRSGDLPADGLWT